MKIPIFYDEQAYTRKINPESKFVLIGNNIDGFVDFQFREFANFDTVKAELPNILYNIKGQGEWDVKLYQVEEIYEITQKYGYYKVPKKGKLIYTHSYMECPVKDVQFSPKSIMFIGCQLDVVENWLSEEVFYENDLMIEVKKIILG